MMASADTVSYQDALDSQYLSSSLSSLSQSRSANTLIVRTYKQATQFYLTKRFQDALDALEPIVTPRIAEADFAGRISEGSAAPPVPAPIAQSSRGTRTKVWVFYLTLLHAIVELGQEEGKTIFGSTRWKTLASKVRDGRIWQEVVQHGYGGNEGDVDADVVVNLATLLLGHMQHQRLNQQRLESYLSSSDISGPMAWAQDGISTPMSNTSSSPKSLASRLKILELYALHILPANEEWEYAQSFIEMNDTLDDERRDAFLHALQTLKEERDGTAQREQELKKQREREIEEQRRREEEAAAEAAARKAEEARAEEAQRKAAADAERQRVAHGKLPANGRAATPKVTPGAPASRSTRPAKKPPQPPPTFYRRASAAFNHLQQAVLQASRNMNFTSMAMLRLLMFILAFLLIVGRQDLRVKVRRAIEEIWRKIQQTVGMAVKVSYI